MADAEELDPAIEVDHDGKPIKRWNQMYKELQAAKAALETAKTGHAAALVAATKERNDANARFEAAHASMETMKTEHTAALTTATTEHAASLVAIETKHAVDFALTGKGIADPDIGSFLRQKYSTVEASIPKDDEGNDVEGAEAVRAGFGDWLTEYMGTNPPVLAAYQTQEADAGGTVVKPPVVKPPVIVQRDAQVSTGQGAGDKDYQQILQMDDATRRGKLEEMGYLRPKPAPTT